MKKVAILLAVVFMAALVGFTGCYSPVEVVNGDGDIALDGDESVEEFVEGVDIPEEDVTEVEIIDGDVDVVDDVDPEPELEIEVELEIELEIEEAVEGVDIPIDGDADFELKPEDEETVDEVVEGDIDPESELEPEPICTTDDNCPTEFPFCLDGECVECLTETDCPEDNNLWTYPVCQDYTCSVNVTCGGISFIPTENAYRCYGIDYDENRVKVWQEAEFPANDSWIEAPDGVCHVYCAIPGQGYVAPKKCGGIYPEPFEGYYTCHRSDTLPEGCSALFHL